MKKEAGIKMDLLHNEITIWEQLKHPNLVQLIDVFETDDMLLLVRSSPGGAEGRGASRGTCLVIPFPRALLASSSVVCAHTPAQSAAQPPPSPHTPPPHHALPRSPLPPDARLNFGARPPLPGDRDHARRRPLQAAHQGGALLRDGGRLPLSAGTTIYSTAYQVQVRVAGAARKGLEMSVACA